MRTYKFYFEQDGKLEEMYTDRGFLILVNSRSKAAAILKAEYITGIKVAKARGTTLEKLAATRTKFIQW